MLKALLAAAVALVAACGAASGTNDVSVSNLPALPRPVANNAVAAVQAGGAEFIISFAGLGEGRRPADTLAATYVFDSRTGHWTAAKAVPGGVGRLASAAATASGRAFVFGGYTVAADGSEVSTPWVHAFDPVAGTFEQREPMPVPVDDAVAVTYGDRFIYLVSGWHDHGNVNLVQRYDSQTDSWSQATPTPGRAVFGHSGGIVGNTIVYCDGVTIEPRSDRRRDFVANDQCFAGKIDEQDTRRIDWRIMPPHPGAPRYRMAAAGIDALNAVVFVGGSDNPYNYDGIGYNGEPSQPVEGILRYDIEQRAWTALSSGAAPSMDHRALARFGDAWLTVGGMLQDQRVTAEVVAYKFR